MLGLIKVVGLTGVIASGKSTVSRELHDVYAIRVIDADKIAHDVVRRGTSTFKSVVRTFGKSVVGEDGEINRQLLADTVFSDPEKRRKLNKIVHPAIAVEIAWQLLWSLILGVPLVILDAPLLFETGLNKITSSVVVVSCTRDQQISRFSARTGCTEEHAMQRISAQKSLQWKIAMADCVIDNSGSLDATKVQIKALVTSWHVGPSGWVNRFRTSFASWVKKES